MESDARPAESHLLDELTITVVHDNYPWVEGRKTAWGFSAHIAGARRNILFDTGSDGSLLLENLDQLRIDPAAIDALVLSHLHGDHAGGLAGLLQANPRVEVYLPASFPNRVKDLVRRAGGGIVEVEGPQQVCENVHTTGVLGRRIPEQALAIRTSRGLVVLTGCAHPGVVPMVEAARGLYDGDLLLVMGGFHLEWAVAGKIERIIAAFRNFGVRYVAPTHCCGEKARERFEERFGQGFVAVGVGKTIALADLP
ncbi:MAG TPA: MBL fold metallo-hydrolase [Sedimentisphaerales bacterium]|nr:MBL fold metallo-hydrolase [Sedimentisphaerales bacterium]